MKSLRVVVPVAVSLLAAGISTVILFRYAEYAGPESFVVLGIGVCLITWLIVYMEIQWRGLRTAQSFAVELRARFTDSLVMVAMMDQVAAKVSRRMSSVQDLPKKAGATVLVLKQESLKLFDVRTRSPLVELVIGVNIGDFELVWIDRGGPRDLPCVRLRFMDGGAIEIVIYDPNTGRPVDAQSFRGMQGHFR